MKKEDLALTQEEKLLYEMWTEVLGRNDFGIDDDFFELGGNSVLALNIISRIGERYEIDLKNVFEDATIRSIASGMKGNQNWAEEKIKFIFHEHERIIPDPKEVQEYQERYESESVKGRMTSKYSSILLLGSTGFLGAYLLHFLHELSDCKISVIVRAKDKAHAMERVQEAQKFYFGDYLEQDGRITYYAGELTKECFGLPKEEWEALSVETEAVLNSAANVKHLGKTSEFASTNEGIVKRLIDFAKVGNKKDIHQVSSIGILFGEQPDMEKTIYTEYDFDIGQKLDNNYLISKFNAEKILYQARNEGIDSEIYRLNGILFDSSNGTYQRNIEDSSAYIFVRALSRLKVIPAIGEYEVDISMVDQIAEAIVRLVLFSEKKNQVYHVIHPDKINFVELMKELGSNFFSYTEMNAEQICEYYRNNLDNEAVRTSFGEILLNCEIFDSIMKNNLVIQQDKTVKDLEAVEFKWKQVCATQLENALNYAIKVGFLQDDKS